MANDRTLYARAADAPACPTCGKAPCNLEIRQGTCWDCEAKRELAAHQATFPRLLAATGVPERYRDCSRETWRGAWPAVADQWFDDQVSNLLISGPAGTGKTHIATAMMSRYLWSYTDARPRWISTSAMLERLRAQFNDDHGDLMAELIAVDLLVLDDLGAEGLTGERGEWRKERVAYLIAQRYDAALPTIITTNLKPARLLKIEPRFGSRLLSGLTIITSGIDRRLTAPDARAAGE